MFMVAQKRADVGGMPAAMPEVKVGVKDIQALSLACCRVVFRGGWDREKNFQASCHTQAFDGFLAKREAVGNGKNFYGNFSLSRFFSIFSLTRSLSRYRQHFALVERPSGVFERGSHTAADGTCGGSGCKPCLNENAAEGAGGAKTMFLLCGLYVC
jgi:hypothetical protein